jgi:hypothetical protein
MPFNDLFEVSQTGNRIDLLTHAGREDITLKTINWWQSYGWEVHTWDNTGNLPAVGRNKIIKDFINSDRQYLIIADDDITLYTHRYLTAEWLKNPITDRIYTLNSNHKMGILKYNSTGWDDGAHHWKETAEISQFYVINRKDIPLQDETLPALEDLKWARDCNKLNIPTFILHTVFLREQSQDRGSLIAKTRVERKKLYARAKEMLNAPK